MAPSFMQSIYRDDTTYDKNLDVIWYSSLLSGNAFADILETGMRMKKRPHCFSFQANCGMVKQYQYVLQVAQKTF